MSSKIIGYVVLTSDCDHKLQGIVQSYLKLGWEPIGGISVGPSCSIGSNVTFAQAIVKYENSEAEGKMNDR